MRILNDARWSYPHKEVIMKQLTDFDVAFYEGFTLKKGFWYGRNLRGQAMASSGWTNQYCVYIYTRTENGWKGDWYDFNDTILGKEFSNFLKRKAENEERYFIYM